MNAIMLYNKLLELGFAPCGSMYVLSQFEQYEKDLAESDYDFWCTEYHWKAAEKMLHEKYGFSEMNVYSGDYSDSATIGISKRCIDGIMFEISVKRNHCEKAVNNFWNCMINDPGLFASSYWKRRTDCELIRERINKFYEVMVP
jgi:hypothetical protein